MFVFGGSFNPPENIELDSGVLLPGRWSWCCIDEGKEIVRSSKIFGHWFRFCFKSNHLFPTVVVCFSDWWSWWCSLNPVPNYSSRLVNNRYVPSHGKKLFNNYRYNWGLTKSGEQRREKKRMRPKRRRKQNSTHKSMDLIVGRLNMRIACVIRNWGSVD